MYFALRKNYIKNLRLDKWRKEVWKENWLRKFLEKQSWVQASPMLSGSTLGILTSNFQKAPSGYETSKKWEAVKTN